MNISLESYIEKWEESPVDDENSLNELLYVQNADMKELKLNLLHKKFCKLVHSSMLLFAVFLGNFQPYWSKYSGSS